MLLKEFFPLMRKLVEKLTVIFCFICNKRPLKKIRAPEELNEYVTTSFRMDETRTRDKFGWYPYQPNHFHAV
jgi:hypothetical protein